MRRGAPHRVVGGDRRGRTIGFPTANLETDAQLLPANGVYAVRARVDGGPWCDAVANLGERPTFDGRRFLIEVHLLDFAADLYGKGLEVAFVGLDALLCGRTVRCVPENTIEKL